MGRASGLLPATAAVRHGSSSDGYAANRWATPPPWDGRPARSGSSSWRQRKLEAADLPPLPAGKARLSSRSRPDWSSSAPSSLSMTPRPKPSYRMASGPNRSAIMASGPNRSYQMASGPNRSVIMASRPIAAIEWPRGQIVAQPWPRGQIAAIEWPRTKS